MRFRAPLLHDDQGRHGPHELDSHHGRSRVRAGQEGTRVRTAGRRRTRVLRDLLAVRGEGLAHPLSVLEQQLLAVLRDAGIEEPDKQVPTTSDDGEQWRLDFVYPQHKVHIEVDGRRYHAGRREQRSDRRRDNFMNTEGWIVLRFTWEDVMNDPGYVVAQVLKALGRTPAT